MAAWRRALLPWLGVVLAGWIAAPAGAEDLPDLSLVSNKSLKPWTLKLENDDKPQVGSIRVCQLTDPTKVVKELSKAGDSLPLAANDSYAVFYLDAPATLTSVKANRCHRRSFVLVDSAGNRIRVETYRVTSPLSNVYLNVTTPLKAQEEYALGQAVAFNVLNPGNIAILADTLPAFVPQK